MDISYLLSITRLYLENEQDYLESFVVPTPEYIQDELKNKALKRLLFKHLNHYIDISSQMSNSVFDSSGPYFWIKILETVNIVTSGIIPKLTS